MRVKVQPPGQGGGPVAADALRSWQDSGSLGSLADVSVSSVTVAQHGAAEAVKALAGEGFTVRARILPPSDGSSEPSAAVAGSRLGEFSGGAAQLCGLPVGSVAVASASAPSADGDSFVVRARILPARSAAEPSAAVAAGSLKARAGVELGGARVASVEVEPPEGSPPSPRAQAAAAAAKPVRYRVMMNTQVRTRFILFCAGVYILCCGVLKLKVIYLLTRGNLSRAPVPPWFPRRLLWLKKARKSSETRRLYWWIMIMVLV